METDDMDLPDPTLVPALETGWLPTTPAGDTYQRRFLLNWAGISAAIARELGGHSRNLPAVHMADSGCPVAFFNSATLMQPLSAENAAATLDEIAAFFAFDSSRRGEALLVSAWPTGDLRLFGWNLMGH